MQNKLNLINKPLLMGPEPWAGKIWRIGLMGKNAKKKHPKVDGCF